MELYGFYTTIMMFLGGIKERKTALIIGVVGAFAILAVLFVFQAIGLFIMAKKQNLKTKWLAFIPFANIMLMGKLAGECSFFGQKMKRAGLYTMLAQLIATVLLVATVFAENYLYFKHGEPLEESWLAMQWSGLVGFDRFLSEYLVYSVFVVLMLELIYKVLSLVLVIGLCKKYSPSNYLLLSFLVLLIPEARFILVFILRKRKAVDYGEYIKAKQEEFIRRHQQYYNTYGNPYTRNPYGNPYGNPYAQNPYNPQPQQPQKPEDPFSEFSSNEKPSKNDDEGIKTGENDGEKKGDSDEFFN